MSLFEWKNWYEIFHASFSFTHSAVLLHKSQFCTLTILFTTSWAGRKSSSWKGCNSSIRWREQPDLSLPQPHQDCTLWGSGPALEKNNLSQLWLELPWTSADLSAENIQIVKSHLTCCGVTTGTHLQGAYTAPVLLHVWPTSLSVFNIWQKCW